MGDLEIMLQQQVIDQQMQTVAHTVGMMQLKQSELYNPSMLLNDMKRLLKSQNSNNQTPIEDDAIDNVEDYCKTFGYTKQQFWEMEAPRLCVVLECTKEELPDKLAVLLR